MNAITPTEAKLTATVAEAPVAAKSTRKIGKRQVILGAVALLALAAGTYYGEDYWRVGRFEESTDDAYVKADFTIVAPKVSGYIAEVLVNDNDHVQTGNSGRALPRSRSTACIRSSACSIWVRKTCRSPATACSSASACAWLRLVLCASPTSCGSRTRRADRCVRPCVSAPRRRGSTRTRGDCRA